MTEVRFPSQALQVRPQGWICVFFLGFIVVVALNQIVHIHLMYVATALLCAMGFAVVRCWRHVRLGQAQWILPLQAHAGEECTIGALCSHQHEAPPCTLYAWDPNHLRYHSITSLNGLSPNNIRVAWLCRFPNRGRIEMPPLRLSCEQPFGFFLAQKNMSAASQLVVLPARGNVQQTFHQHLSQWIQNQRDSHTQGDEALDHLRHYRPGDTRRHIHWKASAHQQQLLVAQRSTPSTQQVLVVLDTLSRRCPSKRFEKLICACATLVDHLLQQRWEVSLLYTDSKQQRHHIQGDRLQLMQALALCECQQKHSLTDLLIPHQAVICSGNSNLSISDKYDHLFIGPQEMDQYFRIPRSIRS